METERKIDEDRGKIDRDRQSERQTDRQTEGKIDGDKEKDR